MKAICVLITALTALGCAALGQDKPKIHYYVHSGIAMPLVPDAFSDYWVTGYNFGGGVGIPIWSNIQLMPAFN